MYRASSGCNSPSPECDASTVKQSKLTENIASSMKHLQLRLRNLKLETENWKLKSYKLIDDSCWDSATLSLLPFLGSHNSFLGRGHVEYMLMCSLCFSHPLNLLLPLAILMIVAKNFFHTISVASDNKKNREREHGLYSELWSNSRTP